MTMAAAGVAKLIEECGELVQVLGKRLAYWDRDDHWDGTNLRERTQEEMGDVLAAISFVADMTGLDRDAINDRAAMKMELFGTWEEMINNNDHGIDAQRGEPSGGS
jgi:NTP pyrophosphatase (non-canonical NTP hydrolase)